MKDCSGRNLGYSFRNTSHDLERRHPSKNPRDTATTRRETLVEAQLCPYELLYAAGVLINLPMQTADR